MEGLTIRNLSKTFGGFTALDDVSLDVAEGEFLAVLGPSGCGKTTLLRAIAGFESVSAGEIAIGGKVVSTPTLEVPPNQRRIGIVFQNYALWPHMTVAQNVAYPLRVTGVSGADRDRRVREALALVDLGEMADRSPASLSGGQRQRVALARCLVAEPSLVLFDEPLANLDVHLRASMEDEFRAFHERTGTTIVYITHDQAEAMALADRIAVMDHGRLMQLDTPQALYHRPANPMVASFISQGMMLPTKIESRAIEGACQANVLGQPVVLRCAPGDGPRANATVCVRAGDLRVTTVDQPGFDGVVRRTVYQGGVARLEIAPDAAPEVLLHLEQPDPQSIASGDPIRLCLTGGWLIPAGDGR
ncbi:ABC transporter ATP-binding protein [Pikeienuella piscinae]|uniref:ABC transporter ATP-binding protein n=1 Tax=Pikeienuella piscinae TaxID=2748098 RepID=A0A7L5BVH2_9RHOB|nr:ABC transporter ATP-binding protein [Pikeienuella piscinae]QIE54186.1 ABC transporter ATP-binding protein [Pikeienuella piscinae]